MSLDPKMCGSRTPVAIGAALLTSLMVVTTGWAQGGPSPVVVAPVIQREVASQQSFVANVNPHRRTTIGSAVDGRVLEYLVNAGAAVEEDQPLAQLRTTTIEIELAGAQAELELREAELAELKNGSRPEEIALAEAATEAARAAHEYAQAKLARARRLFETSAGLSRDEYESVRADALAAAAELDRAQSNERLVREGPRVEQIEQAAAQVEVQQQVVDRLKDQLSKYTIRSPFRGFVVSEHTEAGAWVQQGGAVAEVVEIDPVEVEVFVPESNIRFIQPGDQAQLTVEAAPGKSFTGKIDEIVPLADARARTFPVRIVVDNPEVGSRRALLPGMLARVSLPSGGHEPNLLVPKDALQLGGATPKVVQVVDGQAHLVPVRTGASMGTWIAVEPLNESALRPGDLVVTHGNERLLPGQAVTISRQQSPPDESR